EHVTTSVEPVHLLLYIRLRVVFCCFFFNPPAPTEIYTLSLHDALPISGGGGALRAHPLRRSRPRGSPGAAARDGRRDGASGPRRSEEHTSELQSRSDLVCRLLLEKKKKKKE